MLFIASARRPISARPKWWSFSRRPFTSGFRLTSAETASVKSSFYLRTSPRTVTTADSTRSLPTSRPRPPLNSRPPPEPKKPTGAAYRWSR